MIKLSRACAFHHKKQIWSDLRGATIYIYIYMPICPNEQRRPVWNCFAGRHLVGNIVKDCQSKRAGATIIHHASYIRPGQGSICSKIKAQPILHHAQAHPDNNGQRSPDTNKDVHAPDIEWRPKLQPQRATNSASPYPRLHSLWRARTIPKSRT